MTDLATQLEMLVQLEGTARLVAEMVKRWRTTRDPEQLIKAIEEKANADGIDLNDTDNLIDLLTAMVTTSVIFIADSTARDMFKHYGLELG